MSAAQPWPEPSGATDNNLGDNGLPAIANALPLGVLRRLDVRHAGITDQAALALLNGLHGDHALEHATLGPGIRHTIKAQIQSLLLPVTTPLPDWHVTSRYRGRRSRPVRNIGDESMVVMRRSTVSLMGLRSLVSSRRRTGACPCQTRQVDFVRPEFGLQLRVELLAE